MSLALPCYPPSKLPSCVQLSLIKGRVGNSRQAGRYTVPAPPPTLTMATAMGINVNRVGGLSVWLLIATCGAAQTHSSGQAGDRQCVFQDQRYSPGDTWHPFLPPRGLEHCIRCACSKSGNVQCARVRCPQLLCEHPVSVPQHCCPACPESEEPRREDGRASGRTCEYQGATHQHGALFPGGVALFPARLPNQCVQCGCSEGSVYCALKTCQPLNCTAQVMGTQRCCPVCKEHTSETEMQESERGDLEQTKAETTPMRQSHREARHSCGGPSGEERRPRGRGGGGSLGGRPASAAAAAAVAAGRHARPLRDSLLPARASVSFNMSRGRPGKACSYHGRLYSHGEWWQPSVAPLGPVECVSCTCRDGRPECHRTHCPRDDQMPCPAPRKMRGRCCKVCPQEPGGEERDSDRDHRSGAGCGVDVGDRAVYEVTSATPRVGPREAGAGKGDAGSRSPQPPQPPQPPPPPPRLRKFAVVPDADRDVDVVILTTQNGIILDMNVEPMEKQKFEGDYRQATGVTLRLLARTTHSRWKKFRQKASRARVGECGAAKLCGAPVRADELLRALAPLKHECGGRGGHGRVVSRGSLACVVGLA
ncbi:chordin-like protein 1 [Petromyzon marinus]|uniref:chordin-like protein 1 n=1 Tax=Petromyzon marinus TaxID=7757 RepID=UPI003F6E987E